MPEEVFANLFGMWGRVVAVFMKCDKRAGRRDRMTWASAVPTIYTNR